MDTVSLTIDGLRIETDKGKTILEAALDNDIYIPNLCHHPDLVPSGVCRMCMVEVDGRDPVISCMTSVEQDIEVLTDSPAIEQIRRVNVQLLLANHPLVCHDCSMNNQCDLQRIASYVGIDDEDMKHMRRSELDAPVDSSNPFFYLDPNKCILCGICVRTCNEINGVSAIDFLHRGIETKIGTFGDKPIVESVCESCGECVVRCPVDSLSPKKFIQPSREVLTTCPYCGVGCGIYLGIRGTTIVSARGDRKNPANKGNLCVKGRFGHDFVNHPDRLISPLIKRNGKFEEATWDEALELIAEKLPHCREDKFAAVASAKCTNEENYLLQKFSRAVMGSNNVDHCARLCHAPTVAGLAQSFGSGAMTNSINEIVGATCILAIGTNTTAAHPVLAYKVREAVRRGAKLIVANPREIDLCRHADIFLQQSPGSDVVLLMGMMRVIVEEKLYDMEFIHDRCENFEDFKISLAAFTPDFVEQTTGISWDKIALAARTYALNNPASILFAMGITQHTHGTDNVLATSNLALLTGNVGKLSAGVNPLRGQNNVQGACDLGALPNVYPGYQKVNDPEVKKKFESAWETSLSGTTGLTNTEIFDAIYDGKIHALYMMGENPVLSEADATHVEEALKKLDFLICQDIFLSESAQYADVVLPAASFAEKDGTFTNTERRIQRVRKAIEPVGDSLPDWKIICRLAQKMGMKGFDFSHPREIMEEIASLTPSYTGITYDRIDTIGLQWPCPSTDHPGTQFLHKERFNTKSGRGKFFPLEYRAPAEIPDDEYPLVLTTDRSLYHFHTGTMTRRVEGLETLMSHELLNINPEDANLLRVEDSETVLISSRRGAVNVMTNITEDCPPGVVSMTFHFFESPTNQLTHCALDPVAKIPETKVCAVRIEKIAKDTSPALTSG